jgi:hypothetical protein
MERRERVVREGEGREERGLPWEWQWQLFPFRSEAARVRT